MADKFPGPYRNSVPGDLNNPDPMINRVPFDHTAVGARKSIMPKIKNEQSIVHAPNMHSK